MNLDTVDTEITPFTKINWKQIRYLNIKGKTIKFLEDNIGEKLSDPGYGEAFLDTTPKTWSTKEITSKLDFIKIKTFSSMEDSIRRIRRQAKE